MTETTMAPSELGVRLFTPPPADFDPLTADQRELLVHGFPARPDQETERPLYTQWRRRVSRKYTRIEPVFVRNTDKVHGPMRGPSAPVELAGPTGSHKTNATSTNWSGSAVFAASGDSFKWVEGEWTVADPADPKGGKTSYYSSSWVGIDGWGSPDVLQAGTESSLVNGVKKVYAWWEWYPDFEIAISNFPISAGDTMFCLICATSATTASIWLTNDSTDQSVSFAVTAPAGTTLHGNCAEWIVETPNVGGSPTTLPDYGVVYFDDAQALANTAGWIGGNTGTPITLVNSGGTALSTPTLKATDLLKLTYNDV